ncbi:MAG: hypothetical protein WD851_04095 [Pirellulales bacterium]
MKPSRLSKLAALLSSVVLAGAFVAYSAGAWGWLTRDKPPLEQSANAAVESPTMFSSSKSGILADRIGSPTADPFGPPAPVKAEPPAAFFGGSKTISIAPLVPPPGKEASLPADLPAKSVVRNTASD